MKTTGSGPSLIPFLGTTGDSSGNISWGFNPEDMALFPEVEVNYDVSVPLKLLYIEAPANVVSDVSDKGIYLL